MPDERTDSIRQGIEARAESPSGGEAVGERLRKAAEAPAIGGAMGGTSDADSPADASHFDAATHHEGEAEDDPGARYREVPEDLEES